MNPRKLPTTFGLVLGCGLFFANPVSAQRGGSAASGGSVAPERAQIERLTDRSKTSATRTDECEPATVDGECPGSYWFGYGFTANASSRQGGAQSQRAGLIFGVYLTPRVSLAIGNDNVVSFKEASADRVTGFGDTSVYLGVDALLERGRRPSVSLTYSVKVPTASVTKGIGSGEVDHSLEVGIGKTLGKRKRTYIGLGVGDYLAGRSDATAFDHFPYGAVFLKQKFGEQARYKGHFEIGGDFATSKSNATLYNLNYLETRLSKTEAKTYFGLGTGIRVGITPNVSRAGLYVAIRVVGNLKNVFD